MMHYKMALIPFNRLKLKIYYNHLPNFYSFFLYAHTPRYLQVSWKSSR